MTKRQHHKKIKPKIKKPTPDWEKLEHFVARIQKELAPDAIVTHNDKIRGKMVAGKRGKIRKIDVSIKKRVGSKDVLIALDAKRRTRPVDRGLVAKFAEQVEDIGALGIMISDSGFDGGARDIAYTKNIVLQTLREAEVTDWKKIINGESWISQIKYVLENPKVSLELDRPRGIIELPITTLLFKESGDNFDDSEPAGFSLKDLLWDTWERLPRPRDIGPMTLIVEGLFPPHMYRILRVSLRSTSSPS